MSGWESSARQICVQEQDGQMAVELAVLMPVIIAVALVSINVLRFAELVARFDRVAPDAVLIQGVSPAGSSELGAGVSAIQEQIVSAMPDNSCEVTVRQQVVGAAGSGALVNLAAGTVRYTCTLTYIPWPTALSIAGVSFRLPFSITHERSLVVDRYRAGIIA